MRHFQGKVPWCILFVNDIVLSDETRSGVNTTLEIWRQTLESSVQAKQDYDQDWILEFKFSDATQEVSMEVRLDA